MRRAVKPWAEIEAWKSWFAWYPVQVKLPDGTWIEVWGEWIERRTRYLKTESSSRGPLPTEYRFPE